MQLRWYQNDAIEGVFQYFTHKQGNPVVALPTGTGKSLVIGGFMQRASYQWPRQSRFVCLTHVKELVEQNAKKIVEMWPAAPVGVNSAGLGQRDTIQSILFAGVASVAKNPQALGHRDLVLIDECHLVSPNAQTTYRKVIEALREINPWLKVVGFTATPYRLGQGKITDDGLFTDVCYDMTDIDGFSRLLAEGFLSPLFPRKTVTELDVSGVSISNGDFSQNQLQASVDKDDISRRACMEMCQAGYDRQSWLVFASGVEHAEHVAEILRSMGVPTAAVTAKTKDRDSIIAAFKRGELRCIVNNNVLTTGFDHPPVDLIGMLRPTTSPGLWVQMLGRGTRPSHATGKTDCLVLDFAGNTKRLGPINDPNIPKKRNGGGGDAPVRICDACGTYNHASATVCMCCGEDFPRETKISAKASNEALMRSDAPVVELFDVSRAAYYRHEKQATGAVSLRCDYYSGMQRFSEWVHFEKGGMPGHRAREWWRQRHNTEPPSTVDEALMLTSQLRVPARIRVWTNKQYPEILGYEY